MGTGSTTQVLPEYKWGQEERTSEELEKCHGAVPPPPPPPPPPGRLQGTLSKLQRRQCRTAGERGGGGCAVPLNNCGRSIGRRRASALLNGRHQFHQPPLLLPALQMLGPPSIKNTVVMKTMKDNMHVIYLYIYIKRKVREFVPIVPTRLEVLRSSAAIAVAKGQRTCSLRPLPWDSVSERKRAFGGKQI